MTPIYTFFVLSRTMRIQYNNIIIIIVDINQVIIVKP